MGGTAGWCLIVETEYSKESGVRGSASLKTRPGIPDGFFRVAVVGRHRAAPGTRYCAPDKPVWAASPAKRLRTRRITLPPTESFLGAGGITLLSDPLRLTNTAGRPATAGTDGAGFESREASAGRRPVRQTCASAASLPRPLPLCSRTAVTISATDEVV